jgi:hypothetical protein
VSLDVRDELPVNRLDGFSDAVLAIAITILVLELRLPAHGDEHLLRAIFHEWPAYLAYGASFVTIGVVWLQHSRVARFPTNGRRESVPAQPPRAPVRVVPAVPDEDHGRRVRR